MFQPPSSHSSSLPGVQPSSYCNSIWFIDQNIPYLVERTPFIISLHNLSNKIAIFFVQFSMRWQLQTSTNYQKVDFEKCLQSILCTVNKTVLHRFSKFAYKTTAYNSDLRRNSIEWSYCSSKPTEKVQQGLEAQQHPTTCVTVHDGGPSCQVCHSLVSCHSYLLIIKNLLKMVPCFWMNHTCICQILFL